MKSGFAHFDGSDRENFIAAVLLFTIEFDDAVKTAVTDLVRDALDIDRARPLLSFGREARLERSTDGEYARVDLWFLFGPPSDSLYAFVEVKTHDDWDAGTVANQVQDQCRRTSARHPRPVRGSVLLAPERLVRSIKDADARVRALTWSQILSTIRACSTSTLASHAVHHIEENMERPAGLDRPLTLGHFEQATTTVACLRQFIIECIDELKGRVHGEPVHLTPGDGRPLRGSGWAWHGLSVPFSLDGERGRVGIYKYAEAPAGAEDDRATLWLEVYLGAGEAPVVAVRFAPATLAAHELDAVRAELKAAWVTAEASLRRGT